MIGRAFSGRVSVQNTVAGPITIARAANAYAQHGAAWYLSMLALLSLSLGILNLLPIPILDGGHLLYYLIELVKGSPVSERVMAAGQYVGLALIAGLMGLAFYNDIVNNLVR
jgi:regulator of sigma E protease